MKRAMAAILVLLALSGCVIVDSDGFELWNYMRLPDGYLIVSSHDTFVSNGYEMNEGWVNVEENPIISNPHDTMIEIRIKNRVSEIWVSIESFGDVDISTVGL